MGKHTEPQKIVRLLRDAEAELGGGKTIAQVVQKLGISEQTYYRWRQRYGGMQVDEAKRLKELEAENARLRDELAGARARAAAAANYEREIKELSELYDLTFVGDVPSVAARVVDASPSNFELAVVLDKGTADGVADGMPVVGGGGLVGRVASASRHRATVLLLTDTDMRVGVRLERSGDVGVAKGRGRSEPLTVDFIDAATEVARGEVAVTSGLQQSVFPPGIPVGRVVRSWVAAGGSQRTVLLDPIVDFRRLTFVRVLQ
ncbi:MAG: rod shape-determining protein MreC, partial [Chloroflexota bacterium]